MVDFSWKSGRGAGVFLHISSLPSEFGIGNIGGASARFFDYLEAYGFSYWQICPLGPTGFGDSPYQTFSAFAGNPYFIDYSKLVERGWLADFDLNPLRSLSETSCDFGALYGILPRLLGVAYSRFLESSNLADRKSFENFKKKNAFWLDSYSLFAALKSLFGGVPWYNWAPEFRDFKSAKNCKLDEAADFIRNTVKFGQWVFFSQYAEFKAEAKKRGISIFGDLPIFLGHDSADVWANPELFELNKDGSARNVAGVAPDYFSAEGQLWGNPLYDWAGHKRDVYDFWRRRIKACLDMYDIIRLDHFRGFADYWSIPAKSNDARKGRWRLGPGIEFFDYLKKLFPHGKFVAEDLGILTRRAMDLRDKIKIPAMAVLQFAFGDSPENPYLPHNVRRDCVYYTGTHDNNTSCGWYAGASESVKDEFRRYFRASGDVPNWDMIHAVMMSCARLAIFPMQDIIGLGQDCRMNTPGKSYGNWQWRLTKAQLSDAERWNSPYLKDIAYLSGRISKQKK